MLVRTLAEAELENHFAANASALDQLRLMAAEDSQLIRIAFDFTYLGSNSSWPRKDLLPCLGFLTVSSISATATARPL
jgi:hypothetical protein